MSNYHQDHIPPGMLLRVIQDKQLKIAYYDQLYKMTSEHLNREIINGIHFDEVNHLNMFTNLYTDLYGEKPDLSEPEIAQISSFLYGIKNLIKTELDSYDFYSNVFFTDPNTMVREVFARALTDENRHAAKCNFIYTELLENNIGKESRSE